MLSSFDSLLALVCLLSELSLFSVEFLTPKSFSKRDSVLSRLSLFSEDKSFLPKSFSYLEDISLSVVVSFIGADGAFLTGSAGLAVGCGFSTGSTGATIGCGFSTSFAGAITGFGVLSIGLVLAFIVFSCSKASSSISGTTAFLILPRKLFKDLSLVS